MAKKPEKRMNVCELAGKEQNPKRLMELDGKKLSVFWTKARKPPIGLQDNSPVE